MTDQQDDNYEYAWFRLYHELVGDKKLAAIKVRMGYKSLTTVIGIWVSLLCLAAKQPEPGSLMAAEGEPYQDDEIAESIDLNPEETAAILEQFRAKRMLARRPKDGAWTIMNWDKRQFVKSDQSRIRVAEWRKRQKEQPGNGEPTDQERLGNVTVTAPEHRIQNTDNRLTDKELKNTYSMELSKTTENQTEPDQTTENNMSLSLSLTENQQLYAENIGSLSEGAKIRLDQAEKQYGPEQVSEAIRTSVYNNKKSMAYVETVLANRRNGTPYRKRQDPWNERAGETNVAQNIPEVKRRRR